MILGYNHNIQHKGHTFHVQTEDSGTKAASITTHLFRGGNILATKKTSYADIAKMDQLESIVRKLMQEQHKDMLHRLVRGEYNHIIEGKAEPVDVVEKATKKSIAPAPQKPPGGTGKGLDEIILNYLSEDK